jgi:hypothetical protein
MIYPDQFSGKIIKTSDLPKREVQYGPLPTPKIKDPIQDMINGTIGKIPYEANGLVKIDPNKIEFLGS